MTTLGSSAAGSDGLPSLRLEAQLHIAVVVTDADAVRRSCEDVSLSLDGLQTLEEQVNAVLGVAQVDAWRAVLASYGLDLRGVWVPTSGVTPTAPD